jgi:CheY-like chemotaxis protein
MSRRILVVEDQEDNRQIIRDMLSATDYELTEAENGEQALAAIAKQRPDLILMDIQLPIMDGYEATRRIKADPALKSIPIIAVTGKNRRHERRASMTTCRSPTARANYSRKFDSICPRTGNRLLRCTLSANGPNRRLPSCSNSVANGRKADMARSSQIGRS